MEVSKAFIRSYNKYEAYQNYIIKIMTTIMMQLSLNTRAINKVILNLQKYLRITLLLFKLYKEDCTQILQFFSVIMLY